LKLEGSCQQFCNNPKNIFFIMMSETSSHILIVEVPTEVGTHWYGQSKAPEALLDAGLSTKLEDLGYTTNVVSAFPDGPQTWQPQSKSNGVRDEEAVIHCLTRLKNTLNKQFASAKFESTGHNGRTNALPFFPLIIGGPCTIEQAVLSTLITHVPDRKFGLLMVDSDADLTLPIETSAPGSSAILDSMTMTHLTQREGGLESMKQFAKPDGSPLVTPDNVVLFGLDVLQPKPSHYAYLLDNRFRVFTNHAVAKDANECMKQSLEYLLDTCGCDAVLVHFDVDAVDSGEWPLGNYPSYGGLGFKTVMNAVQIALSNEKVIGLVVTEVNPNNDPTKKMVTELVDGLITGLATRIRAS
jgi:arginase